MQKWFQLRKLLSSDVNCLFEVYQRTSENISERITKNLKPNYFVGRYLIKDRDKIIINKSENLNNLIKTSWNN